MNKEEYLRLESKEKMFRRYFFPWAGFWFGIVPVVNYFARTFTMNTGYLAIAMIMSYIFASYLLYERKMEKVSDEQFYSWFPEARKKK